MELDRITEVPEVRGGRAAVRGAGVTVEFVLTLLSQGMSAQEIVDEYPALELEDVYQCARYAARLLR